MHVQTKTGWKRGWSDEKNRKGGKMLRNWKAYYPFHFFFSFLRNKRYG